MSISNSSTGAKEVDVDLSHRLSTIIPPQEDKATTHDEAKDHPPGDGDLEKAPAASTAPATAEEESDPNVVNWNGPDDPENPMNWPASRRWANIGLISLITFITPLASSMVAPGVPLLMAEFGSSSTELASFVVSVYVLGFAIGPMGLAPMSELYGRLWVYHACNVGFLIFTIACAVSSNLAMLIVFRFIQGCFGACPVTNGGGTIADVTPQAKRGGVIAVYAIGPLVGPVIGPVIGGALAGGPGWRWTFWVLAMISGVFTVACFILLRETYPPILLSRKAAKLRKETGNEALHSSVAVASNLTVKQLMWRAVSRPVIMTIYSPIVLFCSLFTGVAYGYLYLLFTTFTYVFQEQYHWNTSIVGLSFLGIGIGSLIGLGVIGALSDRLLKYKSRASSGSQSGNSMKPEYRLIPLLTGSTFIPIGLFIYGWTAQYGVHWIAPIIGTTLIGVGNIAVFMCIQTYLVDAFTLYAASALAANTIVRSLMGAVLPLAGQSMYAALGLGWGNSLLGFIAVAMLPVAWVIERYGERLRERFDVKKRL